jgi:hypothetical protein
MLTAKSLFRHAATIFAITTCHWDQKVRVEKLTRAKNSSGKFPYGVPMEKLPAACPANPVNLELAKGFEPLTL